MKKLIPLIMLAFTTTAQAQITITGNDLPVVGDTLRYSTTIPLGFNINLNDTGGNKVWNFDTMTPVAQRVDAYKTALQVNPLYAVTISPNAYGYKVADTFGAAGMQLPISITDVYTFFGKKTNPARYVAEGFGAKVSGVGVPANYSDEDEWYYLPLAYGNYDSSDYFLNIQLPSVGSIKQDGTRKTWVDAWGTIKTPFFTTAVNCIRVRSEINEIDSVQFSPLPAFGLPRNSVDYKWLVQGEHYPALWITTTVVAGNETISNVRYRDSYRPLSVQEQGAGNTIAKLEVYPNPASDYVQIAIPTGKEHYTVEVFDIQGKLNAHQQNTNRINTATYAAGNYMVRVTFADGTAYAPFVKQ